MKALFHGHTNFSHDGSMSPGDLVRLALQNKIDLLAVTDHNEIKGAQEVQKIAPFPVIIGEEIQTKEGGEVIGLFLKNLIAKNISVFSAIEEIKQQGGIVYLPHPFDKVRTKQFSNNVLERIAPQVDIVEIFNSRNIFKKANINALNYAKNYNKIQCVGADAHLPVELKGAHVTLVPEFKSPKELLESLCKAQFHEQRNPLWVHAISKIYSFSRRFL